MIADIADLSRYMTFTAEQWGRLRAATPLTLTEDDVDRLRGLNDALSLDEVTEIFLPLSRSAQSLRRRLPGAVPGHRHLPGQAPGEGAVHHRHRRIGRGRQVDDGPGAADRAGPLARPSQGRPDHHRRLPPPEPVLEERGLMERKGFPESYDRRRLLEFVSEIKSGDPRFGPALLPPHLRRARR